jgi:hypothetical protein
MCIDLYLHAAQCMACTTCSVKLVREQCYSTPPTHMLYGRHQANSCRAGSCRCTLTCKLHGAMHCVCFVISKFALAWLAHFRNYNKLLTDRAECYCAHQNILTLLYVHCSVCSDANCMQSIQCTSCHGIQSVNLFHVFALLESSERHEYIW